VGKYTRPQNCAFSDIFGTDLTRRVVALCMGIAICHRQKFEQVWGFPAPYQKLQENYAAGRYPFGPSNTWKNRNHSAINHWAVGWSPEGTF